MALWLLVGSVLVLVVVGMALFVQTREQILVHTHGEALALSRAAADRIEARLGRVAASTRLLAAIAASDTRDAEGLLRTSLRADPDLAGLAIAPLPHRTRSPAPFVSRQDDGSVQERDLAGDLVHYWDQYWFLGGLACDTGCWQRPFHSRSRQRLLVNYSVAIRRGGQAVGVVNADVTLEWLQRILETLRKPAGAYTFVLGSDGRYLAHDQTALVGQAGAPALLQAMARQDGAPVRLAQAADGPVWIYPSPIKGTFWSLGLVMPEAQIYADVRILFLSGMALGLFALIGIALITLTIIRRTLAPLGVLVHRAEHVARGELDFDLPATGRRDEIGRLTGAFDQMRHQLAEHLRQLTEATREQQRLASELEIAHQIQTALLPKEHYLDAHCPNFELHAALRPARAVGGDLYSYFMLDERRFYLLVGDVSDKGIPAALFMARTITLAKALAPRSHTPQELLRLLNQELCRNNDGCMFVTLLCGVLDTIDGTLVLASAGHEPPVLCDGESVRLLEFETGAAVGLDEEAVYPAHEIVLRPGDTLLLYTDGITEAADGTQAMFGTQRLLDSLLAPPLPSSAAGYTSRLLADVDRFVDGASQADDITVLALSWLHQESRRPDPVLTMALRNTVPDVFEAIARCDRALDRAGVSESLRSDVQLVLEEMMVNIVEHGYPDRREGTIGVRMQLTDDGIVVELHSDGVPFDPTGAPPPALTGDLADQDAVGGLGIHLVRSMVREMDYSHDAGGNHLRLHFPNEQDVTIA
ncbi:SpoIIE family protein phosphatase [Fulvimonas yonginensis]|uniref:SpoIIE family protein phosphatase n=1 Tax=Fulvimonas yonginensis TaxID=1495200 RepID=A0ABU8JCX4_9GAMM